MSKEIKLPESVRVGFKHYKIELWPSALASASELYGECDKLNHVIRVREDLNQREAANTLLHEILHAAYDVGACDGGDEEKIVTVLANQLTQVWQDSPEVMNWIGKRARGE